MGRKMRLVVQLEKRGEEREKKIDSKKDRAVHDNLLKQISDTVIVQSAMEIFDGELVDMKIDKNRK